MLFLLNVRRRPQTEEFPFIIVNSHRQDFYKMAVIPTTGKIIIIIKTEKQYPGFVDLL